MSSCKFRVVSVLGMAVLLGGLGLSAPSAHASEKLREGLCDFAKRIKAVLEEEKQEAIAVGEFTCRAGQDANAGPGIQQLLIQELRKLKVPVHKKANLTVNGGYGAVEDKRDSSLIVLKLRAEVRDASDNRKTEMAFEITSPLDIARLVGLTISLPINLDDKGRREDMKARLEKPSAHINGTQVRTKPSSPYAVEVRVRSGLGAEAVARAARLKDGTAFVPIERGELYEVRVFNDSKLDAAVSLTIDGLDVFTFSEVKDKKTDKPAYTHFIVGAGRHADIVGWHRNNRPKGSDAFQVTAFANSEAAKMLSSSSRVGTITVCFHAAWEGKTPPEDEEAARSAGDGTRRGPPVGGALREVQRTIGVCRDVVSVRYSR